MTTSAKKQGGKTYKITFSYPSGYISYVDDLIGAGLDLYWNEELVANSAAIAGCSTRPQKDTDPLHLVVFDCDGADTAVVNMADKVDTAGDLKLVVTQMAMNLTP